MKRLVLLTGEYPFAHGDVDFVRHEIGALAARYDEVVVFNYARRVDDVIPMPPNVTYAGNLFERNRTRSVQGMLSPSFLRILRRALTIEHRGGRLKGHRKQAILSAIQGMRIVKHPALREAVSAGDRRVSVYAFWGMGAALCLPWLPPVLGGVAVRLHRFDLYETDGSLPLRLALFASVRRVLAISEDGRRYLIDRFAPSADLAAKTVVSRLGTTDPGPVVRQPRSDATITVVSCSSVIPVKRVTRIADALELLGDPRTVRWVHFGDGPLMEHLRERITGLVGTRVAVELRGVTPNADVLDFYRRNRVDVFVNVSESEGVPVSIMEAMSFDIPVVATAVGGTPEIVHPDLRSGELVSESFTNRELADQIAHVLTSTEDRYDPRGAWERLCDADVNSHRLVELLDS